MVTCNSIFQWQTKDWRTRTEGQSYTMNEFYSLRESGRKNVVNKIILFKLALHVLLSLTEEHIPSVFISRTLLLFCMSLEEWSHYLQISPDQYRFLLDRWPCSSLTTGCKSSFPWCWNEIDMFRTGKYLVKSNIVTPSLIHCCHEDSEANMRLRRSVPSEVVFTYQSG